MSYHEDSSDIWQQQDQKRKIEVIQDSYTSTNTLKVIYISKNGKHLNDHQDKQRNDTFAHYWPPKFESQKKVFFDTVEVL